MLISSSRAYIRWNSRQRDPQKYFSIHSYFLGGFLRRGKSWNTILRITLASSRKADQDQSLSVSLPGHFDSRSISMSQIQYPEDRIRFLENLQPKYSSDSRVLGSISMRKKVKSYDKYWVLYSQTKVLMGVYYGKLIKNTYSWYAEVSEQKTYLKRSSHSSIRVKSMSGSSLSGSSILTWKNPLIKCKMSKL